MRVFDPGHADSFLFRRTFEVDKKRGVEARVDAYVSMPDGWLEASIQTKNEYWCSLTVARASCA
jgi:hypothetical protein